MNTSRLERAGAIAIIALVVIVTLATQFLGGAKDDVAGSVESNAPRGRRALSLLFAGLGASPETWRKFPGALPRGEHIVWLARAPSATGGRDVPLGARRDGASRDEKGDRADAVTKRAASKEGSNPEERTATPTLDGASLDFQSLAQYRRFVEGGGTLVLPAGPNAFEFLVRDLDCAACSSLAQKHDAPAGLRRVRTSVGAEWSAQWAAGGTFETPDPESDVQVLWRGAIGDGETGEVLAVVVPLGSGRVVCLGDDRFLDNDSIGKDDHALLAVALFEELSRGGRLLFDEHALGLWEARTPLGLAVGPRLALASAHLACLLLLAAWRATWVSRFPRDPLPLAQLSPLARARAQAGLFERAGRYTTLARTLRNGVLDRLRVRARMARDPRAVARTEDELSVQTSLAHIARRAGLGDDVTERWRRVFSGGAVHDREELDALGRELAAIEAEVDVRVGRAPAPDSNDASRASPASTK